MTVQSPILDGSQRARLAGYTDLLSLIERLHRLILDVIKDEFERLGLLEINGFYSKLGDFLDQQDHKTHALPQTTGRCLV